MAFFPCTRFEVKVPLLFRGEGYQQKKWSDVQKLEYGMKLHKELHELYEKISQLAVIFLNRGLKKDKPFVGAGVLYKGIWHWSSATCADILREYGENFLDEIEEGVDVTAWMPLPEPYKGDTK